MRRRIAVTGLGAITPLGNDLKTTWENAVRGVSGIGHVTLFDSSTFPVNIAGEVKGFVPSDEIPREMELLTGRSAQLGIKACAMALQDSGLDLTSEDTARIGISLGGDEEYMIFKQTERAFAREYIHRAYTGGPDEYVDLLYHSPMLAKRWTLRKKTDLGSKLISICHNIRGPVETSHTACSSSGHAIGKAKRLIENGDCDVMITGGHCSMISEFSIAGFYLLGTLSTQNQDPPKASRPFDLDRDGFVMGEGAGIIILEELERAKKRGATIYGELAGYGSSSNAYRLTDTPPDGRGGDLAMSRAIADAQLDPSAIDYINAHGTATLLNDRSETLSIKNVFKELAYKIPISSSKSMLGHLVCSSSAVELIITIMAVKNDIVPPTVNLETPDPLCDLDYVPNTARQKRTDVALSNSLAFGGQNATLIVRKFV